MGSKYLYRMVRTDMELNEVSERESEREIRVCV